MERQFSPTPQPLTILTILTILSILSILSSPPVPGSLLFPVAPWPGSGYNGSRP